MVNKRLHCWLKGEVVISFIFSARSSETKERNRTIESFFYAHKNTWLRADRLILFENNLIPEDNN